MDKHEVADLPDGKMPILRLTTRPYDANPSGDIFGGWLLSQVDIGAGIVAGERARGPVATVAVKELLFLSSVFVQDVVNIFAEVVRVGNTSLTVEVEVYSQRMLRKKVRTFKVSEATLVFVAMNKWGKARPVK